MKSRMFNRKRVTAAAIIALFGMAEPVFAWRGNGSGLGMGYGSVTADSGTTLSAEQQKLDAKASELAAARSRGNTTVSRLNALESEILQLERRYRTLLDQANAEASRVAGSSFGPYFTCGHTGCNHRYHSSEKMTMGPGRRVRCCW